MFSRKIIELGAGSGLLGLALLKSSERIESYTFTDYSPMILNLLRQNASLNFSDEQLETRVKIEELDWNQFSVNETPYDLILAAGLQCVFLSFSLNAYFLILRCCLRSICHQKSRKNNFYSY